MQQADKKHPLDARDNLTNDGVYTYTLVTQGTSATVSTFTWDLALRLPQVLGTSNSRHLYGYGRIGVRQADAWHYPLPDALGSARQWADGTGSLAYAAGYTPFGVPMWQQGSASAPWGYTGEYWDANVGLLYLRARWYDPTVGRFTQADRIVPNPLNSQAWNRYAYGLNNPLLYTDPSGYCADNQDDPVCKHVTLLTNQMGEVLSYEVRVGEPGKQPIDEELAAKLNFNQAFLDSFAWVINTLRGLEEAGIALAVMAAPPSAPALAVEAVLAGSVLDGLDTCIGISGALISAGADYLEGYTYTEGNLFKNPETFTVVIGGDSAREIVLNTGNTIFRNALVDWFINTYEMIESWKGLSKDPNYEVRLPGEGGVQIIEYVEKCK